MNIYIANNTSYDQIRVINNGHEVVLMKNESAEFLDPYTNTHFEIKVLEKNMVLLNLIYALVDGFIDGESVVNSLVCDASFDVAQSDSDVTVELKNLEYRDDKNGYIYESTYVECDKDIISNLKYSLTDVEKARKKSMFYYIFVVSWLPVLLIFLGFLICYGNILDVIAVLGILCIFSVPSWKKARKVKVFYTDEIANKFLSEKAIEMSSKVDCQDAEQPKDIVGKMTYKVLDALFKKKK